MAAPAVLVVSSGTSVVTGLPASSVVVVVTISVVEGAALPVLLASSVALLSSVVSSSPPSSLLVEVSSGLSPSLLVVVASGPSVTVADSEKLEQAASPADCAFAKSSNEQLCSRQGPALAAMATWVGPHWHPMSSPAQPAALTALLMQAVYEEV
jgi:hypothetical protein